MAQDQAEVMQRLSFSEKMNILVLGGTQFVGRHIVEACLRAGHSVSILTRGRTVDELPPQVERLRGDRDQGTSGLEMLTGRSWDACVDVSGYTPQQVRASAEKLHKNIKHYIFISAVSVYGDPAQCPVRETTPLLPPAAEDVTEINGETYGPLKVACEAIIQTIYKDRCTLLRPQVVVGPYDHTARYTYWLTRAAQGGEMLAPGDGSDYLQVIDARDLAQFTVRVVEGGLGGAFNLAGPRITWAKFMNILNADNLVWVDAEIIKAVGLTFVELPLFRPQHGARSSLMNVSSDRAQAAGLKLTTPEVTVRDTQAWILASDMARVLPPEYQVQLLSPEREAELIRISRQP